ncbi:flippase [Pleurocapsa sp. PCC 7319]|uniref:flippase n=1 Tax=Pleurocapsa sp. PCC 7319 TaxID=118161 RepID=UPI00034613A7|nr:flippase [Pleurocapsa sp. PCC 7319]
MNKGVQYLQDLWQTFLIKNNDSSLKQRLIRGVAGTFGLKLAATGLNFLTGILLARLLGASGFGVYTYAFAWTQLLILAGTLGLDKLIVREVAIYQTKSEWSLVRGLLQWANQIVLIVSVVLALGAIGVAWGLNMEANSEQFWAFCVAMLLIPIAVLRNLRLSAMRGLHQIVIGLMPELILAPLLLLVLTGFTYLFLGDSLNAFWVVLMRVVAALITLAIGVKLLDLALPNAAKEATPKYQIKTWLSSALPFMFLGSLYIIKSRTDILMLGAIQGAEAAGIYFAVSRGAHLINFILGSVNTVLGPNIANLYAEGKTKQLQRVMTKSARVVLLIALPITATMIGLGHWYLSLFGKDFSQGQQALTILCVGQLAHASAGSVGLLLNMTGNERFTFISNVAGTGLNVILNVLLIPRWGIEGAALATTSTTILVNIINTLWVRQKLGIDCTALGKVI